MTTPFQSMAEQLRALGFTDGDQKKDFDCVIPYVVYLRRAWAGKFQYVSLISYEGRFCEAVYELFAAAKNTRCKATNRKELERLGGVAEFAMIYRSLPELLAVVERGS